MTRPPVGTPLVVWSPHMIAYLRQAAAHGIAQRHMARTLGISLGAVQRRLNRLGISNGRVPRGPLGRRLNCARLP